MVLILEIQERVFSEWVAWAGTECFLGGEERRLEWQKREKQNLKTIKIIITIAIIKVIMILITIRIIDNNNNNNNNKNSKEWMALCIKCPKLHPLSKNSLIHDKDPTNNEKSKTWNKIDPIHNHETNRRIEPWFLFGIC